MRRTFARTTVTLVTLALLAAACGGGSDPAATDSAPTDEGAPA